MAGPHARVRTPTILQMEAAECGAAALGIILAHFGCWMTLEELRRACNTSRDGSSARSIVRAARSLGMEVAAKRMEPHHLRAVAMPVIVHWGMNHFLVVEGYGRGTIYLNDPAQGPRQVSEAEFSRNFTGIVLSLRPGAGFRRQGQPPSLRRGLAARLRGSQDAVGFVCLMSIALVLPGLLVPVFTQIFIDQILVNHFADWLGPLLLGMAICGVLTGLLTFLQREALLRMETRLAMEGALRCVEHIVRLPLDYFGHRHPGELAGRAMLNDRVAQLLASEVGLVLFNLLAALAYLVAMLLYAPLLCAVTVLAAAVNLVLLTLSSRLLADQHGRLLLAARMQTGFAKQGLQMIESYKAAGMEDLFRERLVAMQARVLNLRQSVARAQIRLNALPGFTLTAVGGLVLVIGGDQVIRGEMTLGMLVAFQALMAGFLGPMAQLVQLGARMQDGHAYLRVLDDTLQHPPAAEYIRPESGAERPGARLTGAIAVQDLCFNFSPGMPALIDRVTVQLAPGERLGIVGASGSGKSTLGALLAGIHAPTAGCIYLDDVPLDRVPRQRLRQSLAYVDQRAAIFEGSIRENIGLWDHSLPDERIVAAARMALIHDVILRRPGGYGAKVLEGGSDLSGGQRARLEIARALVRDPRILILDEATAMLDAETEAQLFANLRGVGATTIIIAHRHSAIRDCDRVIVLDQGRVVQEGRPADLLASPGPFRLLMQES